MLLPPSASGTGEPPRVSLFNATAAFRTIVTDLSGVCERNPAACRTSGEALVLVGRKLETGAGIVAAGIAAGETLRSAPAEEPDYGTLEPGDLEPTWSAPPT